MLYKLAHIIKDKFSFLWEAIEWGNASLFYMLHKKQLAKVNKILEGISPKYIIRLATNNDVDILVHFFREQPEGAFKFFRPHEFDEKAVRKVVNNKSFLTFSVLQRARRLFLPASICEWEMLSRKDGTQRFARPWHCKINGSCNDKGISTFRFAHVRIHLI